MLLAITQYVLFLSRAFAHPQPRDPFRISPGQMVAPRGPHALEIFLFELRVIRTIMNTREWSSRTTR